MDEIIIQKQFYRPFCSEAEIERVFNVVNAKDHLLKLRADTIADHVRLFRVFRRKVLDAEGEWTLESSFNDSHYNAVISKMPKDARDLCKHITYGNIFSDDPNGMIFSTKFGPVSTISESLRFFLKFAHLAILDFSEEIPQKVRVNALRIAIRVMLRTEALDFYMDPRGIIPNKIAKAIHEPIPLQLQFIAGHELSHYVLGHLSEQSIIEEPIFYSLNNGESEYKPEKVYSTSQKQEFEADLQSILLPKYSVKKRSELLKAALLWFGCIELYNYVKDIISPQSPWRNLTHPSPRERYENLLENVPSNGLDSAHWKEFPKLIDSLKAFLLEDVSTNIEGYEVYGSAYLDEPNTEWRGRELIDRVDY